MKLIRDLKDYPKGAHGAVLALGNFDGVHLGHQAILQECVSLAKAHGTPSAAMTFEPHPREFFNPDHTPFRIHSFRQKIERIRDCGIEHILVMRFNARFAGITADQFVEDILHKILGVKHVVTGYNFYFGKGRKGDSRFLTEKARALNFGFTAHPQVMTAEGKTISSSAIRELLAEGDVQSASAMLGRPYRIYGHVSHGQKRGKGLGFPTINLPLKKLFKPRFGVYAARVQMAGEQDWQQAVANLGVNPTFSGTEPLLEAHCFDMQRDVYGQLARVELTEFIRDEKKFESIDMLKNQMFLDSEKAKVILHA